MIFPQRLVISELKMINVINKMGIRKCEHNKNKYKCRLCNPSAYCDHGKYKYSCRECKPELKKKKNKHRKICEHNRRKDSCVKCSGCPHGKMPYYCIKCGGKGVCEHGKVRSCCKDCKGGHICEHGKIRSCCKDCGGSQICEHKKNKRFCRQCNGSAICEHGRQRTFCRTCGGGAICEHDIRRIDCKHCSPHKYFVHLQRQRCRYILKKLGKSYTTTHYLGCNENFFLDYIKSRMTTRMTMDNIHIDHIKPVSKFNLNNIEEVMQCCHWSNLQPLLSKDNLTKSNKWTDKNEIEWKNNITKYK